MVRKHRAPKGALRQWSQPMTGSASEKVRKHRAPKGALRRYRGRFLLPLYPMVRKHRAPKGALRHFLEYCIAVADHGQKAPSAKRCIKTSTSSERCVHIRGSQKAPSAKRCIKTPRASAPALAALLKVRKHRAPKGALRRVQHPHVARAGPGSESTERQKVH